MVQPELHFYPLDEHVTAFSTTRHGGTAKVTMVRSTSIFIVATVRKRLVKTANYCADCWG